MTTNSDHGRQSAIEAPDVALDITGDICPMTFVRTRLLLDRSAAGTVLTVRLKGREPLTNVPRSARELGHTVLSLAPETPGREEESAPWLLTLRKKG